jgi:hypothetical protein
LESRSGQQPEAQYYNLEATEEININLDIRKKRIAANAAAKDQRVECETENWSHNAEGNIENYLRPGNLRPELTLPETLSCHRPQNGFPLDQV